jgi:hypothetical protein
MKPGRPVEKTSPLRYLFYEVCANRRFDVSDERDTPHDALNWHPAFLQAIQQELFDYRDSLEFKYEYQLNSEPLRIDLLIIKKPENITIGKNIARIFRTDNLLEYKSPEASLSV